MKSIPAYTVCVFFAPHNHQHPSHGKHPSLLKIYLISTNLLTETPSECIPPHSPLPCHHHHHHHFDNKAPPPHPRSPLPHPPSLNSHNSTHHSSSSSPNPYPFLLLLTIIFPPALSSFSATAPNNSFNCSSVTFARIWPVRANMINLFSTSVARDSFTSRIRPSRSKASGKRI